MPNDRAASVQICRLRVARLDAAGVPAPGPNNLYVTDALIRLSSEPEVSEGEDIEEKNGCGDIVVAYQTPHAYKHLNIELELVTPDPELEELIAGGTVLTLAGEKVGHMFPALRTAFNENGVSLEAWSKAIINGAPAAQDPWWRWVLPKVKNWQIGQRELQNGNTNTVLMGQGIENDNWFDGPANDWYTLADEDLSGPMAYVRDSAVPDATAGAQTLAAS